MNPGEGAVWSQVSEPGGMAESMGGAMGPQKMKTKDAEVWNYSRSGRSPLRLLESP